MQEYIKSIYFPQTVVYLGLKQTWRSAPSILDTTVCSYSQIAIYSSAISIAWAMFVRLKEHLENDGERKTHIARLNSVDNDDVK